MAKKIIGMQIGNKTLNMTLYNNGVVEDFIKAEIPENMITNEEITSYDAMGDFIKEILEENRVRYRNAALVLSDRQLFVRRVKLPLMTIEQLKVNLPYEFRMYITEDSSNFVYDYYVINIERDKDNPKKGRMELLAAALEREKFNNLIDMFQRAGLDLDIISLECLALKNIFQHYESNRELKEHHDYGIVDLGAKTVKIHFFSGGEYNTTRTLEIGCQEFIDVAAFVNDTDVHSAKIAFETNRGNIQNHEEMIPLYENLAVEIMRVINFYKYNNADTDLDCIYVCGGGANIEPLLEHIKESLDINLKTVRELFDTNNEIMQDVISCPQSLGIVWEEGDNNG